MALVISFGQKRKKKRPNAKSLFSEGSKPGKTTPEASGSKSRKRGTDDPKGTTDHGGPRATPPGPAQKGPKLPFLFDEERNLVRLRRQRLADLEGADFISKWKNSDAYIGSNTLANINRWQDLSAEDIARSLGRDKVLASDIRAANQKRSDLRSLDYQIRTQAAHDRAEAFYELWKENNRKARAEKIAASTESEAKRAIASAQQALEQKGRDALAEPVGNRDERADYKGGRSAQKQDRAQGSSTSFNFDAGVKPPVKSARAAAQSGKYLDSNGQVTKERQAEIDKEIAKGGTKIFVNGHELTRRVSGYLDGKPIYTSGVNPSKAKTAQEWQQRWAGLKQKAEDAGGELQGSLSSPVQITDRYTGERLAPTEVNRRATWGKMARESEQATQQIQALERKMNSLVPTGTGKSGAQNARSAADAVGNLNDRDITKTRVPDAKVLGQNLQPHAGSAAVGVVENISDHVAEPGYTPRVSPSVRLRVPDAKVLDRGFRSIGRAVGTGFSLDGEWGSRWDRFTQPRIEGMRKFGDRVGSWFGETLQTWADRRRKLPKQKKRDYTGKRNPTRTGR